MRAELILGDARDVLATLPDACCDALVSDPPAGVSFMQKDWDGHRGGRDQWIAWLAGIMAEARRVIKPGGYALVWALPRTSHWTAMALEDAGWTIRDSVAHMFGCLSEDTEILTEDGWEPYHKAVAGRRVLGYNVDSSSYQWQPIEELFLYAYRDTAYRLHSDHTDQLLSRNHRVLVERGGSYVFDQAENLERHETVPVLEDVPGLLKALSLHGRGRGTEPRHLLTSLPGQVCPATTRTEHGTPKAPRQHKVRPALGQVVRALRNALHLPHALSGPAQHDVLSVVQGSGLERSTQRQTDKAAADGGLPPMRQGVRAQERRQERGLLQQAMQWPGACPDGQAAQRQHEGAQAPRSALRGRQSRVEGRRHLFQDAWQLCRRQVRALSCCLPLHGAQGRLCYGASAVGGSGYGPDLAQDGGRAPHRPRSNQQCLEQPAVVRQQPGAQAVRGARFTRADLVTVEPVHYDGVVWCVRVPSGAFVARRNGKAFVTGNSGFPKSQSCLKPAHEVWWLAKAPGPLQPLQIDACRVATGEVGAPRAYEPRQDRAQWRITGGSNGSGATSSAGRWPPNTLLSHHPECQPAGVRRVRVAYSQPTMGERSPDAAIYGQGWHERAGTPAGYADADGYEQVDAWTCAPGCPVAELDRQAGYSSERPRTLQRNGARQMDGWGLDAPAQGTVHGDAGGKSRFFPTFGPDPADAVPFRYVPKASRAERSAGLDAIAPTRSAYRPNDPDENSIRTRLHGSRAARNPHPCVKPRDLMAWLVKLVTVPGGVVLDPLCGSGSTGVACVREGFGFIGIEMSEDYAAIARARIAHEQEQHSGPLFAGVGTATTAAR